VQDEKGTAEDDGAERIEVCDSLFILLRSYKVKMLVERGL
jgi:hypothetical protein